MAEVRERWEYTVRGDEDREAVQHSQTQGRWAVKVSARVRQRTMRATVGGVAKE